MSMSDRTRRALAGMGMTSYEIRAFGALLGGEMTASDLSRRSGVPYSKVYEVLGVLEEKGWIGSDESRPTRYFAKSPATGLEATRQRREADFARGKETILNELVPLYERSGSSEKPEILVIWGAANIAGRALEMVGQCKREVMVALPEAGKELVSRALPKLRSLHDRGVKITVLTSDRTDRESLRAASRVAEVKTRQGLFGGGVIADRRHVMILLGQEIGGGGGEAVAIWAEHEGLAGFASEYFEYLLKDSKPA